MSKLFFSKLLVNDFGFSLAYFNLTEKVDHKAVVVAIDIGGRVGLKLYGDIRHGRVELEVRTFAAVLAKNVR